MTTAQFIEAKLRGTTKKTFCSSVVAYRDHWEENETVYSYGSHYPLVKILNGYAFVNNRGYSVTTSKHIGWAFQAAANVVGYANTFGVPLTEGDSLTEHGILSSAKRELARLEAVMATKKRRDTWVFSDLQRQHHNISDTINAISKGV